MINFSLIFLFQERAVSTAAERYLLVYMIGVLIIVTTLIILFFVVFQKRKNKLLIDKIKQQQAFEAELSDAQTEIQEQTLKNIGWELHDNVGQLLAVASMQMNILKTQISEDLKENFVEASGIVKQSLNEVRALSKSLNNEVILNVGFEKSISNELMRLERMKFESAQLNVVGESVPFSNKKHEIILFRILQEFFSNTVKYAQAKNLKVALEYQSDRLCITAFDDGLGFDVATVEKGSGLLNMQSRAALINTEFNLTSTVDVGTKLELVYPFSAEATA